MTNKQYTIRNISSEVDIKLRAKALREKKSLNQLLLDELTAAVALTPDANHVQKLRQDYDDLLGSWQDDPGFDEAMKDMRRVDPSDWL